MRRFLLEQKGTKKYIKNWKELSKDDQKSYTEKGYYDSKAKAKAAAEEEVAKLLQGIIEDKRSKTHTWTAKEIEADARHNKNTTTKTKKQREKRQRSILEVCMIQKKRSIWN
jgi:hypothetical protein